MRLRFSIRDLLWLTALVAMGFGWYWDWAKIGLEKDNLRAREKSILDREARSENRADQLERGLQERQDELDKFLESLRRDHRDYSVANPYAGPK